MSDSLDQIAAALRGVEARQVRVLTGTVVGTSSNANSTLVRLDNDGTEISTPAVIIPSICGLLDVNTRVSILTVPPAGMIIIGEIGATYNSQSDQNVLFPIQPRIFPTAGAAVWTKPTSPQFLGVIVELMGGGGGSGGTAAVANQSTGSAGGQGGAYLKVGILASDLPATVNVTVAAGGLAGAAPSGLGGTGGSSTFAGFASATGGQGGAGGGAAAADQTTQTGGDNDNATSSIATIAGGAVFLEVQAGSDGGQGFRFGGAVLATSIIWPGFGGNSRWSGQRRIQGLVAAGGGNPNHQIAPAVGRPFGGGASGRGVSAAGGAGIGAGTGAAGGDGAVIVTEILRV